MEMHQLEMLDQHADMVVHDGLGQPRGARGIHHPQGMVVRHADVAEAGARDVGVIDDLLPGQQVADLRQGRLRLQIGQPDDALERGQGGDDLLHFADALEILAAEAVAVGGEEHLGLDLRKAVHHGLDAELGRRGRPDAADGDGRQHRHRGLRDIRHVRHHPVAWHHAQRLQLRGDDAHLPAQFVPAHGGERLDLRQVVEHHFAGHRDRFMAQHVLRIVHPRAFEPFAAGHLARVEHAFVGVVRDHFEVIPDRGPESLDLGPRPLPERAVVGKVQPAFGAQPVHVLRDIGGCCVLGARRPEQFAFADHRISCDFLAGQASVNAVWPVAAAPFPAWRRPAPWHSRTEQRRAVGRQQPARRPRLIAWHARTAAI